MTPTLPSRNLPPETTPQGAGRLTLSTGERWYVAVTLARKERYACANLANQGYRYFLPQHRVTRRHARQFRSELAAVFPRYVFVILNVRNGGWRKVRGTFGVHSLICEGDSPLAVPPGVVETLVASSDPAGSLIYEPAPLAAGDKVRLISGPLSGTFGVLQSLDEAGRVRLLLEFVGGVVKVAVRREAIEARR
jgi:transcription antitermination factor NusG